MGDSGVHNANDIGRVLGHGFESANVEVKL